MRVIDTDMLNQLRATTGLPICTLLHLTIGELEDYSTSNDTKLGWGGKIWRPRGMQWDAVRLGNDELVNSITITIDDVDRAFYAPLMEEGPDPHPADMFLAALNADYLVETAFLLFRGTIDSWQFGRSQVRLEIGSLLTQWSRSTLRLFSASCRWESFRGPECGYSGTALSCTRTYLHCVALGNQEQFGGFRWLPGLEGKEIPWGLVPDEPPVS